MRKVLHWPLDEDSGDALDYSGSEENLSTSNITQGSSGQLGTTVYDFNGSSSEALPSTTEWIPLLSGFGISLHIYPRSTASQQDIIMNRPVSSRTTYTGQGRVMILRIDTDGSIYFYWDTGGGNFVNVSSPITTNTWQHVGVTWDQETIRLYIDGVEKDSIAVTDGTDYQNSGELNALGSGDGTRYYDGLLSDVRIYDGQLTPNEISYFAEKTDQARFQTDTRTL